MHRPCASHLKPQSPLFDDKLFRMLLHVLVFSRPATLQPLSSGKPHGGHRDLVLHPRLARQPGLLAVQATGNSEAQEIPRLLGNSQIPRLPHRSTMGKQIACERCSGRKIKCDLGNPCAQCALNGSECKQQYQACRLSFGLTFS